MRQASSACTAKIAQTPSRIYAYILSYTPTTAEEGKKINSKDVARALYCTLHYGAPSAPLPTQFLVYFVIGAISGVANVITFAIFFHNGLTIEFATPVAFLIAAAPNYALCIFSRFSPQGALGHAW